MTCAASSGWRRSTPLSTASGCASSRPVPLHTHTHTRVHAQMRRPLAPHRMLIHFMHAHALKWAPSSIIPASHSQATHVVTCFGHHSGHSRGMDYVTLAKGRAEAALCHWVNWSVSNPYPVRLPSSLGGGRLGGLRMNALKYRFGGRIAPGICWHSRQFFLNLIRYSVVISISRRFVGVSFFNDDLFAIVTHDHAGTRCGGAGCGWTRPEPR